jgi:fructose-bisphosphate aldolase, class II
MAKAKLWFERARQEKFAIGSFNAASIEALKAIVLAAKDLAAPVMVEASPREAEYFGIQELAGVVRALEADYQIPILLNLDHAGSLDACRKALAAGFDYLHFDGSKLPYDENVRQAGILVTEAHAREVLVEGEIDNINVMGASSEDHRGQNVDQVRTAAVYTDPQHALDFVTKTGVDTFASFVGNVHGLYSEPKNLDLDLLRQISAALPEKFLSLHGGSGIPETDIRAAINLGVVKVNVNSELRVAFRETLKETLDQSAKAATYDIMPPAIAEMRQIVTAKIRLFGSAGKLS